MPVRDALQRRCGLGRQHDVTPVTTASCIRVGLVNVGLLGPMRKADIPLSAIDFHCSTIADDVQQAGLAPTNVCRETT